MATDKMDVSKSEFILSQSADLHPADVVVNARDAGLEIDLPFVYRVRALARARRRAWAPSVQASSTTTRSSATSATTATSATADSSKAAGVSPTDFVRTETKLSPKKVVKETKSAARKPEVRSVRRADQARRKPAAKKGPPLGVTRRVPSSSVSTSNEEEVLKIIAAEMGLRRALEVLQAERSRVLAIFGG